MLETRFFFISKILFLAFFLINIPNLLPVNIFDSSYFLINTTTILDTTTLIVLSLGISRFLNIKNLQKFECLLSEDVHNEIYKEKVNLLNVKVRKDKKISIILFIVFLIITLSQPLIFIFNMNKLDIYSANIVQNINIQFEDKKKKIEEIYEIEKQNSTDDKLVEEFEDSISNLSEIKNININKLINSNNKNKLKNAKIIIRNFLLGALWSLAFYKFYLI